MWSYNFARDYNDFHDKNEQFPILSELINTHRFRNVINASLPCTPSAIYLFPFYVIFLQMDVSNEIHHS